MTVTLFFFTMINYRSGGMRRMWDVRKNCWLPAYTE